MLAIPALTRCLLDTLTLCYLWQKGGVALVTRVVIVRGRVSIGDFLLGGECTLRDVVRNWCIFFSFYFRYITSCILVLWTFWHTLYLYSLYIDVCFLPTLTCVVSFLSLYTCFLHYVCNLLFLFHTKMSWWVLFKVFQKYMLSKSICHKLFPCKVFQEFVLG